MKKRGGIFLATLFVAAISAQAQTDYGKEIEKWRSDRETNLKKETGWLTVAGLFWLKEGTNTVGAGENFDVRLTDNFKQGKFGEIEFKNGAATLKVENGVEAQADGKSIAAPVALVSDENGKPTEIRTGTQTFFLIKREERTGIRLKDSNSEARRNFQGMHWFPADESYKVVARFEPFAEPKEISVPNVLGGKFKMKSPGALKFSLKGKEYALQPVDEGDGTLFIIFRDKSSENETYKSGRFLYADKPVNGEVVLDFNKAENPPCAFTAYATCPLPPPGNSLDVEIKAGEKRYDH
ncbi:MAG TPA: DUF1684 domain-containing protein [Chthoniobacterales bacterium]|nr:DUF1684 domain-containing protein [Chthoniobacterales bacterium]